ncbi:MAG: SEC-C metal-binding domain-containing protein, partial [Mariprofundaceae bacterium]|nr:SEC-C metal-binding domain-containing protein [Mariprofundaceae bacterium]
MLDKPEMGDEFMDAMEDLLEYAAEQALKRGNDGEQFIADFVQDARDGIFSFFEPLMDQDAEPHMIAQAAWPLALSIWNVMPLPCNNYRPLPIPMPKRNEPCRCGSSLKFKKCCARMGDLAYFPIDQNVMTKYLLEALPDVQLKEVWECLPHPLLGHIAGEWVREDRDEAERALMMLNPIFKQPDNKLNHRDDAAL